MKSLHRFALSPWLAVGIASLALSGCAVSTDQTVAEPSTDSVTLTQISDQEYVRMVREVLGVALTGNDAAINGPVANVTRQSVDVSA